MDVMKRIPVREQEPQVRATNFEEVCYGYNKEEAVEEASRCLNCKNAQCVKGCPVSIDIPAFILNHQHFRQSAVEYVLRNLSVKENVSEESKEMQFQLES